MQNDLTKTLSIGSVDDDELAAVLGGCFNHGTGNTKHVDYQSENGECAIRLEYEKGAVVRAERGLGLTPELLKQVVDSIQSALLTTGSMRVSRSIAFSLERVNGFWRYRDVFQIIPAPRNAPDPTEAYADHPFVIEARFQSSSDWRIQQLRSFNSLYAIRLLLHLFVNGRITWPSTQTTKEWVFVGQEATIHSEWLQVGYTVPDFVGESEDFTDVASTQRIDGSEPSAYFNHRGTELGALTVPLNLEALFDVFYQLSHDDQEQFLRACFWYYTASIVFDVTPSLHYNSLITAIETLMGETDKKPCECCGKDTSPGPTSKFKSFLTTYAPGKHNAKDRDAFYDLRSKLSHGARLFKRDLPTAFGVLHPTAIQEWDSGSNVSQLTRIGLINWLTSHGGST